MALTVRAGVVGLLLSVAPAWAVDFSAELDFVTRASNSNLFATAESQLALERTRGSQVKAFARRMLDEHGKLRGKSGADFNRAYLADQGENHSNALTLYADYMLWGENEKLHALAVKMIPIAEAELKEAQALAGN